jgi:hypothetical protein
MELEVGILAPANGAKRSLAGWALLLDQEGVPYRVIADVGGPEEHSVVIVGARYDRRHVETLRSYLRGGGAVLCTARLYAELRQQQTSRRFVRYLLPEEGSQFPSLGILDIDGFCEVVPDANTLRTSDGEPAAFVGEHSEGHVVCLPFDAGELVLDQGSSTLSFHAARARLPFETVSRVAKSELRKLVSRAVELLHHRRGLPHAHLWYYPSDEPTVFSLRIDTDSAGAQETERLFRLAADHALPFSWFLDVKSQEASMAAYGRAEGHELGVHCYEHRTFDDEQEVVADIRRALAGFSAGGLPVPRGYCAPFGRWSEAAARAAEHCGFEYASEFSYDYDGLPSFPVLKDRVMNLLEVPVHPVAIGGLRRQGFSEEEMMAYFASVALLKASRREPLIFYHHPLDGHERVLESLFALMKTKAVRVLRMADYASWWKLRSAIDVRLRIENSVLGVRANAADPEVLLHVTNGEGNEAFIPTDTNISLSAIPWAPVPGALPLPADIRRVRDFNPWVPLIRVEDFITKRLKR